MSERDSVPAGVLHLRLVVQCGLRPGAEPLEPEHGPGAPEGGLHQPGLRDDGEYDDVSVVTNVSYIN